MTPVATLQVMLMNGELRMNRQLEWVVRSVVLGFLLFYTCIVANAQSASQAPGTSGTAVSPAPQNTRAGEANTSTADPFPPIDPKNFTAASPTVATVDGFLKAIWGYDLTRIWRVVAIQTTAAPGVSRVTVFVSDKTPGAKVQPSAFFVTPDGKHAIAGDGVISFGLKPFEDARKQLVARAAGPALGSANKALMFVEFADMQCPHCKEAQGTMDQLRKDFPGARVVYESFPLTAIHPFAFKAAAYGACVAKQGDKAFFSYLQAVYDAQDGLTPESGDQTLRNAVTKVGLDAAAVDLCAATPAAKDAVNASLKLGEDVGVDQTPLLAVNGHLLPINQIPYETLKTIIAFQAAQDGVSAAAATTATP